MNGITAIAPQTETLEAEVRPVLETLKTFQVVDGNTFERAAESYAGLIALEKKVGEYWDGPIEAAHKVHKDLVAKRKAMLDPLGAAKIDLRGKMKTWQAEEDRKRAEIERQAAEAARKTAEAEQLAKAVELEQQGRPAEAEAALAAPTPTPTVIVQSKVPAGYGNITRKTWKYQVTDLMTLVKAVAAGTESLALLQANEVNIGALVRSQKGAARIPGVKVWEE